MVAADVTIRALTEDDLDAADEIFRLAFGTFLGLPEPREFAGDADYVHQRFAAGCPGFAAEAGGKLIGSNFVTRWGSVGFFGPLTILPEHWDQGVGSRLMEPTNATFDDWGVTHRGLFTFVQSPKHIGLYGKAGFSAGFLTAIMAKPVAAGPTPEGMAKVSESDRDQSLAACRNLTDAIYPGLDLAPEIEAVQDQGIGETVLVMDGDELAGFAVCHCGAGSEAGSGGCYVKFGAARPGAGADDRFDQLLNAVEALATERGLEMVLAGGNMGRREAFTALGRRGFRTELQGVAMHAGAEAFGYHTPGNYVIDDWR